WSGTTLEECRDRLLLVVARRARQVEVDGVLVQLRFGDPVELDREPRVIRRHETNLVGGLVVDLPPQRFGPEGCEKKWVVRVEAQRDKTRRSDILRHTASASCPIPRGRASADRQLWRGRCVSCTACSPVHRTPCRSRSCSSCRGGRACRRRSR